MGRKRTKNTDEKLKENLLQAIDQAILPGMCLYVVDGNPCCVIAQLATIEGLTVDTIAKWDTANEDARGNIQSEEVRTLVNHKVRGSNFLKKYDLNLLFELQNIWDNAVAVDYEKDDVDIVAAQKHVRQLARKAVEDHYAGITDR